jgi:hypothetical protein
MYQALAPTLPVSPPTATCTLVPAPNSCYRLHLQGKFPPQWLAGLSCGLASRQINILQGHASKSGPSSWEASFLIAPPLPADKIEALDFLAMTQGRGTRPTAEPRLDGYQLVLQDNTLLVEVKGTDSIGFLVALLNLFACYSLFPAQVDIDTPAGMVHDRFFLKGLGGTAPSTASIELLRTELTRLRQ